MYLSNPVKTHVFVTVDRAATTHAVGSSLRGIAAGTFPKLQGAVPNL